MRLNIWNLTVTCIFQNKSFSYPLVHEKNVLDNVEHLLVHEKNVLENVEHLLVHVLKLKTLLQVV